MFFMLGDVREICSRFWSRSVAVENKKEQAWNAVEEEKQEDPKNNDHLSCCWEHTESTLLAGAVGGSAEKWFNYREPEHCVGPSWEWCCHFVNVTLCFSLCFQKTPQRGFMARLNSRWRSCVCGGGSRALEGRQQWMMMFWWKNPCFYIKS